MPSRIFLATALGCLIFFCAIFCAPSRARPTTAANQMPSVIQVPAEAQASPHFDATAATNAYLAQIPADKTARSDAYFEGGYWLILWDFLYGAAIALLLLNLRWSARMRDLAERVTRFKPVHTFVYWLQYLALTSILIFPLTVYEGLFPRTQVRTRHANLWPLDGRSDEESRGGTGAGRRVGDAAVRHCPPPTANLVDLGRGRDHSVLDFHRC